MTDEQEHRWLARFLVWQCLAALLVGWNVSVFSESWTNWNILSIVGQAILLFHVRQKILQLERMVERWVAQAFRRTLENRPK